MLLLKFVKVGDGGQERPVGALNWYPIHPTDRGQKNTLVTGDNKGYASSLFEQQMGTDVSRQETFVAAFANANCGDVSGNVELGHIPDGVHDRAQMEKHGRQQFEVAERLFQTATEEVTGPVEHRHTRVDFSNVTIGAGGARTWPAALGVSFAAGSSEDSVPEPDLGIHEGITAQNINEGDALITGVAGLGLSAIFGVSVIDQAEAVAEREGHLPKPVVLMPGIDDPPAVAAGTARSAAAHRDRGRARDPGRADDDGRPPAAHAPSWTRCRPPASSTSRSAPMPTSTPNTSQPSRSTPRSSTRAHRRCSDPTRWRPISRWRLDSRRRSRTAARSPPGPAPTPWSSPTATPLPLPEPLEHRRQAPLLQHRRLACSCSRCPTATKTIAAGAEVAYPEREFTGPPLPDDREGHRVGERRHPADDGRRSTADDRLRWLDHRRQLHAATALR